MNIESLDGGVSVTLSRRNLVALITRLVRADPKDPPLIYRMTENGVLWVRAEEDDIHYQDRRSQV